MGKTASEGAIFKLIEKIGQKLENITEKVENKKGKSLEIIVLVLYSVGHFLMTLVHEPWFDEALAWLIARDSTVKEVLLEATHYEGHPGLWHLALMPFAKLGLPYELSLSFVSYIFTALAIGIILWKAPFKRIIRLIMPFTYFMFYQYSVISRPYCMMMLAFVLIALFYKSRNHNPGRYIASMAFLCATSAYGIVIAGGLCVAWLLEMWLESAKNDMQESRIRCFWEKMTEHGKIIYLVLLLVYALSIIVRILPSDRAYASIRASEGGNSLFVRLIYTIFGALSDVFVTNAYFEFGTLRDTILFRSDILIGFVLGLGILAVILYFGRKAHKLLTFIIPYTLFTVFTAFVYMYPHHLGIYLLFLGFWVWICKDDLKNKESKDSTKKQSIDSGKRLSELQMLKTLLPSLGRMAVVLFICIPLYWNVASCILDVYYDYGSGRATYNFLLEQNLDKASILCEWNFVFADTEAAAEKNFDNNDVVFSQWLVNLAPYIKDSNILNVDNEAGKPYKLYHYIRDIQECKREIDTIANLDCPDVLIGWPALSEFYDPDELTLKNYSKVFEVKTGSIWKGMKYLKANPLSVRKEIAEEKGLAVLSIAIEQ